MMHHVYTPKFYIAFVFFHFSWIVTVVPREILEDNAFAKFWRANMVYYGR